MDASTQTPSDIPTALAALSAAGVTAAPPLEAAVTDAQWLVYASSGVTRTGTLGPLGAAIPQQTFGLDREWFNVVPLGGGRVAFQRGDLLTVGEVRPDGSCVDVRDNHQVPINHSLVAVGADMVISYLVQTGPHGYVGRAIIGRIRPDGAYVQLSESHLWDFWTHIVPVQDGLVLFYNAETRLAATGRVTPDGGFADLQNHPGFDPWTHVLPAADGTLFFFHKPSGAAAPAASRPTAGSPTCAAARRSSAAGASRRRATGACSSPRRRAGSSSRVSRSTGGSPTHARSPVGCRRAPSSCGSGPAPRFDGTRLEPYGEGHAPRPRPHAVPSPVRSLVRRRHAGVYFRTFSNPLRGTTRACPHRPVGRRAQARRRGPPAAAPTGRRRRAATHVAPTLAAWTSIDAWPKRVSTTRRRGPCSSSTGCRTGRR